MTVKDRLHRLVDELSEAESVAAERYLEYLRNVGGDPLAAALAQAPTDDEPLTAEDLAELEAARAELGRGEGRGWEDVIEHSTQSADPRCRSATTSIGARAARRAPPGHLHGSAC